MGKVHIKRKFNEFSRIYEFTDYLAIVYNSVAFPLRHYITESYQWSEFQILRIFKNIIAGFLQEKKKLILNPNFEFITDTFCTPRSRVEAFEKLKQVYAAGGWNSRIYEDQKKAETVVPIAPVVEEPGIGKQKKSGNIFGKFKFKKEKKEKTTKSEKKGKNLEQKAETNEKQNEKTQQTQNKTIKIHTSPPSPFSDLPSEILGIVFCCLYWDDVISFLSVSKSHREFLPGIDSNSIGNSDEIFGIKITPFSVGPYIYTELKGLGTAAGNAEFHFPSPEVLMGIEFEAESHLIFQLGGYLFLLLFKESPFYVPDSQQGTFRNLIEADYQFPEKNIGILNDSARDFISRCLVKEPSKRLTLEEAMNHPLFSEEILHKADKQHSPFLFFMLQDMVAGL